MTGRPPNGPQGPGTSDIRSSDSQQNSVHEYLMRNSPDALVFLDESLIITQVNPAFQRIFGYEDSEALGRSLGMLWQDGHAYEHIPARGHPAVRKEGSWRQEERCRRKDGSLGYFELTLARTGGAGTGDCMAILRDVTQARQAQQEFEQLFHKMLNGFALHEIISDEQGKPVDYRFLAINPAFELMTGLKSSDIIGRSVLEVMPGIEPEWIETYGKVALTGEPVLFEKYSGSLQKHFKVTAYRSAPGRFACIFEDVTEKKRAAQEKARMEQQLAQARKMDALGTLASGIAHDFNNILAVIMGYSELAQDEVAEDSPVRQEMAEITKAATKAKGLVRQILTFSRKAEGDQKAISVNQAVNDAANMLRMAIPKMIDLKLELNDELWQVKANAQQIEQIVLNMATNAADAIPDSGEVTISTRNVTMDPTPCEICGKTFSGRHVLISVKDNGMGMSPAIKSKIYEPFFTTKELGKGTGLGLSTVYGILISHGGHLVCRSQEGAGTEFFIYLPALEDGGQVKRPNGPQADKPLSQGATVLVVDDEPAIREIAATMLKRNDLQVLQAGTGEEALAIYQDKREEIDAVLMDLGMPGMGGKGCLAEIRKLDPEAKVIIASGYIQYELTDELQSLGAAALVAKPYRMGDLLGALHKVLASEAQPA